MKILGVLGWLSVCHLSEDQENLLYKNITDIHMEHQPGFETIVFATKTLHNLVQ